MWACLVSALEQVLSTGQVCPPDSAGFFEIGESGVYSPPRLGV